MTRRSDHESAVVLGKMEVRYTASSQRSSVHPSSRKYRRRKYVGGGMCFILVVMVWSYAMPSMCLRPGSPKSLPLDAALLVRLGGSLREVLQRSLGVSLDGLASFCPVCRADLSIFVLGGKR